MTEQEKLEAVLQEFTHGDTDYTTAERRAAREILAIRKQLVAKDELIQSQRGLIEEVCKREAEAQRRVAELEQAARCQCPGCGQNAKFCPDCPCDDGED